MMGAAVCLTLPAPVCLTLPVPPSANRYWRSVQGRVLVSREARAYKAHIAALAQLAGLRPTALPVALTLWVFRPRRAGDLDNYVKILADSLKGVLVDDDDQVVELHAYRGDDKRDPRVEVRLEVRADVRTASEASRAGA